MFSGKGKIEIQIPKFNFSPGETIEGTVVLALNKPIKARGLKIRFFGERVSSRYTPQKGTQSHDNIIFDFTRPLDGEKEYISGTYRFQIKIPVDILPKQDGGSGVLNNLIKSAQILSGASSRTSWYILAFLDIPMAFDVSKKIQVNIA
jgi:hypothetical protein